MSKVSRFKAAFLVGLVLPTIALSSCVNDLLTDVIIALLFD
jgi:hypothetical protein